jgi:hypothetical protein
MSQPSDVGALVLTLGEPSTSRALAGVAWQEPPIQEVVVVEGVTPFHRALNTGAERMKSPFFVQVDADFVLDSDCVAMLRSAMAANVGITVGALRDPLMGPISGVKLFRRGCFAEARLEDTIAPEVDFLEALDRKGWLTRYLAYLRQPPRTHTLGEHRPAYTVEYVYGTYYLLGARYCSRGDVIALQWRFAQLRRSRHRMAPVARVAMAHGMFAGELRDVTKPLPTDDAAGFLCHLAFARDGRLPLEVGSGARPVGADAVRSMKRIGSLSPGAVLEAFLELGAAFRLDSHAGSRSAARFRDSLGMLGQIAHPHTWIAEAALGHGALAGPRPPIPQATMVTLERLASPQTPRLFPRPA